MNIGCIGLGKMGEAIAYRASKGGHTVWTFDEDEKKSLATMQFGARACNSIEQLVSECSVIWLMLPAGKIVDDVLNQLYPSLRSDMIIIDGGNSWYQDSQRRAEDLASIGVHFLDIGTSGGVDGKEKGFSLMIGGAKSAYDQLAGLFRALAALDGYAYMGPSGSGHYVKMIHNGIEYSLLQAYAEGIQLLQSGPFKELDLEKITKVWQNGSIIRSWIGSMLHDIVEKKPDFNQISGSIEENGTGAWMHKEATALNIKTPMLDQALAIRTWSRETGGDLSTKLVALLRNRFGGHPLKKEEKI